MHRRGFTLIELIIAVGLGLTLCFSAFACLQVCGQTAATATRLSTENQLLRAGYLAALDELDYWGGYDDPGDPSRQPLRAAGRPFQPLGFTGALAVSTDQSDPDNWWRGLPIRNDTEAPKYGRYELVASTDPASPHHRQPHFIETVYDQLGFYGLFAYAPANTIFSYADAAGNIPATWGQYATAPGFASANEGMCLPHDFYGISNGGAYLVTRAPGFIAGGSDKARFDFWNSPGYVWPDPWTGTGWGQTEDHLTPMPLHPAHWSNLDVVVRHFAATFRMTNSITVGARSPTTGETINLMWTMTSTTLRGARRQRDAAAGWARTGQPTLDD